MPFSTFFSSPLLRRRVLGRRKRMPVEAYLERHLRYGPVHLTLVDPDRQSPEEAGHVARAAAEAGSHGFMVGGSTPDKMDEMDATVRSIKKATNLPVILFPGGSRQMSPNADAIWFMSLLNSRSRDYLIGEQVRGAPYIHKLGMEAIPMGYIVVEPGGAAGRVGQADLVKRDDIDTAIAYALTAQYFGMRYVYLEAGSGSPQPVPPEMVRAVKRAIDIPLIVGGGLRFTDAAQQAIEAGADIIVTGTLVEGGLDVRKTLTDYFVDLSDRLRREVRRRTLPEDEA